MKTLSSFSCIFLLSLGIAVAGHAQELRADPSHSKVYVTSVQGDFELDLESDQAWTFKTALGKVHLPMTSIHQIQFAADGASVDVHTLAGDRWLSELPQDLLDAVSKASPSYTANRSVGGLRFMHRGAATNAPVEGLWQFRLADQGVFMGRIVGGSLEVDGGIGPLALHVDQIHNVSVIQGDPAGLVLGTTLMNGQEYRLKPLQSRVSIADQFGNLLKVSLSELLSFGSILESKRVVVPVLPQRIRLVVEGAAEQSYEIPGSLISLDTAWGDILFSTSELIEIRRKPGAKQVWLQTVYGDVMVGKINAKTWRIPTGLDGEADGAVSTRKIAELNFGNSPIVIRNRQWWHCEDGSRVRGTFKRPSYRLRINRDGESSWENIPASGVHFLEPTEDGRIMIASGEKRYSIRPIASEVEMSLDYNGQEYALPWANLIRVEKLGQQKLSLLEWMKLLAPDEVGMVVQDRPAEVLIHEGSFWMGRQGGFGLDDEQPAHKVNVDSFYMDKFEVSVAEFRRFAEAKNYTTEAERSGAEFDWTQPGFPQEDNEPAVFVSWFDAVAYCNWRSREAGLAECYSEGANRTFECDLTAGGYRLPTEAEWEFVASERGAVKKFVWGDSEDLVTGGTRANFSQSRSEPFDGFVWTAPVDAFPANALGVFGLEGNVWEWCEDWYHHDAYFLVHRRKMNNPIVLSGDAPGLSHKVMRGGSFSNELDFLRSASRGSGLPIGFAERIGFRCVRGIAQSEEH